MTALAAKVPEYASFNAEATAYVAAHPFVSAAIFLPIEGDLPAALSSLAASAPHTASILALQKRSRGFVYALPRTNKSYAFLFVAGDATAMGELVNRFVSLPAAGEGKGEGGKLVDLAK